MNRDRFGRERGVTASRHLLTRVSPLALLLWLALGCDSTPSDLREWRASDHDHTADPGTSQVQVDPSAAPRQAAPGLDDVTIVAWRQNCVTCHGSLGRGDGPRGPMVKARDLSDPEWQKAATDAQIARSIREGIGAMPAFNLPAATVDSLVRLVRLMNRARTEPAGSAAPAASAP